MGKKGDEIVAEAKLTPLEARRAPDSSQLVAALRRKAAENSETMEQVSDQIGISPGYYRALLTGHRNLASADPSVLRRSAEYLGLPVVQVFLLAGTLEPSDFYLHLSRSDELSTAFDAMSEHPDWAGYTPKKAEWEALDERLQIFIIKLFEKAASIKIFSS